MLRLGFQHMCLKTQVQLDTDQVAILMLKLTSSLASNISGSLGQHTKESDRQHNPKALSCVPNRSDKESEC